MATSDSDNFESADEDTEFRDATVKKSPQQWITSPAIDSDSDDNVCANPTVKHMSWSSEISDKKCKNQAYNIMKKTPCKVEPNKDQNLTTLTKETLKITTSETANEKNIKIDELKKTANDTLNEINNDSVTSENKISDDKQSASNIPDRRRAKSQKLSKSKESVKPMSLGAKKLGSKIMPEPDNFSNCEEVKEDNSEIKTNNKIMTNWNLDDDKATKILRDSFDQHYEKSLIKIGNKFSNEIDNNVPEELKSDKKFKEIFRSDGWQELKNENEILLKLENKKEKSLVLDEITKINEEKADLDSGWGSWGGWGVTSLLNTASAGVSTLTSHVTHGLSILEESINIIDPEKNVDPQQLENVDPPQLENTEPEDTSNNQTQDFFGFSNLISGVSSITKLVESTGTKVITGGLSTLETIGKKTMEVLQEGDPGLKKKRAYFINELNKPILSQMLREAKEKAEADQKTIEKKEQARRVHFEILFDDFEGLVHLEALENISKLSNMEIQQRLVTLSFDEGISLQETLEEVKELCDFNDEDDDENNQDDKLKEQLAAHYNKLGITTPVDKLCLTWEDTQQYIDNLSLSESTITEREIFERAISTLAQFTAYCVELFHKNGELLLIKSNRSTVNETDALVNITKILIGKIGEIANVFSKCLNDRDKLKTLDNSTNSTYVTSIFLESSNASSYVREAFRLLIPILQHGVI